MKEAKQDRSKEVEKSLVWGLAKKNKDREDRKRNITTSEKEHTTKIKKIMYNVTKECEIAEKRLKEESNINNTKNGKREA